jgi:hypothetical protein
VSSQGRSGAAGPSRSHRSTTAGEVAVGDHRWPWPVERKGMTGGAAVSVRAGEGAGARARGPRCWATCAAGPGERAREGERQRADRLRC